MIALAIAAALHMTPPSDTQSLDTSGSVRRPGFARPLRWTDLDAFEQGYIEALFGSLPRLNSRMDGSGAEGPVLLTAFGIGHRIGLGFSDLAPETLAAILRDCTRYEEQTGGGPPSEPYWGMTKEMGAEFFRHRQFERWPDFPPLRVTLNDAGKVVFS